MTQLDCQPSQKMDLSRRKFLLATAGATALMTNVADGRGQDHQVEGHFPVSILLPRDRVPLSFIIDDSTCLVNMGHFCTPQFAQAWPDRAEYQKPWQKWPREIPDAFVREFGEWSAENQVKGKYSIVPYPACVGWLDRELPGWTRAQLNSSLALVRDLMVPNWDIHPEMITHTRVIDIVTGRPVEPANAATMENSFPQRPISIDQLAQYMAYALNILKNCGFHCEGITTPGGFGNSQKSDLALAVRQAVADVFQVPVPHYFKYVRQGEESTEPVLEQAAGPAHTATVNVPAGTGDWFGGWQGDEPSRGDLYLSDDGQSGRMAELIHRRQPAVMLCHWPGIYCNGRKTGFRDFQRIVKTLNSVYGQETQWMKLSEIARYWAAKNWTKINLHEGLLQIDAPLEVNQFTFVCPLLADPLEILYPDGSQVPILEVDSRHKLNPATCYQDVPGLVICLNLPQGRTTVRYR